MKVTADKVAYSDLKRGDLVAYEGQDFWDTIITIENIERVNVFLFINPDPDNEDDDLYRITIQREAHHENNR